MSLMNKNPADKITAAEAKQRADSITNTKNASILNQIYDKIRKASDKGEHSVTFDSVPEPVKAQLVSDGYTIKYNSGDPRDYEPGYNVISW